MSSHSRDPMWFCHECHAEMRPLMSPDPICASCRGSFVEQIEDTTSNDPREYQRNNEVPMGLTPGDLPPGIDGFLATLQGLMAASAEPNNPHERHYEPQPTRPAGSSASLTFQIGGSSGRSRSIIIGGTPTVNTPRTRDREVPTLTQYLRRRDDGEEGGITGSIMAHYLMSLLGHGDPLSQVFGREGGPPGQMGDYVFNQEALDEVITQIMNTSDANHPVPATAEIMEGLPREVLEENSPTLTKECAVCKDQFTLQTEDPDEQVVLSLPCKHVFHEGCIIPWLKSSGTCPVCRFALIPQPEHHEPPPRGGGAGTGTGTGSGTTGSGGFLSNLFSMVGSGNTGNSNSTPAAGSNNTSQQPSNPRNNGRVPGQWEEELD